MEKKITIIGSSRDSEKMQELEKALAQSGIEPEIIFSETVEDLSDIDNTDTLVFMISNHTEDSSYEFINNAQLSLGLLAINYFSESLVLTGDQRKLIGRNKSVFAEINPDDSFKDLVKLVNEESKTLPPPIRKATESIVSPTIENKGYNQQDTEKNETYPIMEDESNDTSSSSNKWIYIILGLCIAIGIIFWMYKSMNDGNSNDYSSIDESPYVEEIQEVDEVVEEPSIIDTIKVIEDAYPEDAANEDIADKYNASFFHGSHGYSTTSSGLKYVTVVEGTGPSPSADDVVTVHYEGRLTDGSIFDSSIERGEPASFPLRAVIKGWTEGLQLMKTGGTTIFYIPSHIAYGETGTPGGPIGPNTDLIFNIQLLDVKKE